MAITNTARYQVFGRSAAAVEAQLVAINFVGRRVKVHRKVAAKFARVSERILEHQKRHGHANPWRPESVQCFCWRMVRGSESTRSMHSWAIALDIDPAYNPMTTNPAIWAAWRLSKRRIPEYVLAIFRAEGFVCGADWRKRKDFMHVEWPGGAVDFTPPPKPAGWVEVYVHTSAVELAAYKDFAAAHGDYLTSRPAEKTAYRDWKW